jgi:hypothetical protein
VTGFAAFGDTIVSNPQYIRLAPPPSARFNISAETIYARMETSPASFGSDEIALNVLAVPILSLADMSKGSETNPEFRFDDMDTGEWRQVGPLFNQEDVMEGLVMTILGFEVDNERAYREMITDFWSLFVRYLGIALIFIGLAITAGGGLVGWGKLAALALAHPILAGIAVAVLLAGVAIVAA